MFQSYCLKVKEMDDEEYSCIVSTLLPMPVVHTETLISLSNKVDLCNVFVI